jgi:hypothetical protein
VYEHGFVLVIVDLMSNDQRVPYKKHGIFEVSSQMKRQHITQKKASSYLNKAQKSAKEAKDTRSSWIGARLQTKQIYTTDFE